MMFKLPNTMTFRLTLWYSSAFVIFLLVAFIGLYLSINTILNNRMDEDLKEDIDEFNMLLVTAGMDAVITELKREEKSNDMSDTFLRLFHINGQEIISTDLQAWKGLRLKQGIFQQLQKLDNDTEFKRISHSKIDENADADQSGEGDEDTDEEENEKIISVLETIEIASQEYETRIIYGMVGSELVLQIGQSQVERDEIMELLFAVFVIIFSVVIPLASGVGWFVARQAVQGIKAVSYAAVAIEKGELDSRVSVTDQRDEIQNLADTFNSMAERIRKLIAEMREMTDNIAHDLRSPLARIRAISEEALSDDYPLDVCKKASADTLEECDRLIQLINTTLDVAEAEAGVGNAFKEEVNISKLTEDACELFEPVAEEKRIDLTVKLEEDCLLQGNKHSLQRMIANLLDNALKYTPEEGKVSINLSSDQQNINLAIADTGIGIPESDHNRVFDRFFRCDQSRSKDGCGLGLSFSRAVARSHGGDISLESIPTQCSIFTISFPTAY